MKRKEMMKQTMAFTLALSMLGGLACTVSASEPEKKGIPGYSEKW